MTPKHLASQHTQWASQNHNTLTVSLNLGKEIGHAQYHSTPNSQRQSHSRYTHALTSLKIMVLHWPVLRPVTSALSASPQQIKAKKTSSIWARAHCSVFSLWVWEWGGGGGEIRALDEPCKAHLMHTRSSRSPWTSYSA